MPQQLLNCNIAIENRDQAKKVIERVFIIAEREMNEFNFSSKD